MSKNTNSNTRHSKDADEDADEKERTTSSIPSKQFLESEPERRVVFLPTTAKMRSDHTTADDALQQCAKPKVEFSFPAPYRTAVELRASSLRLEKPVNKDLPKIPTCHMHFINTHAEIREIGGWTLKREPSPECASYE